MLDDMLVYRSLVRGLWPSTAVGRNYQICLCAMLLTGCTSTPEPVTLNFPHGWAFRPDELATRAALSQRFTRETGIRVRDIPTPESTFDQLELYRKLLRQGSSGADLMGVDLIWTVSDVKESISRVLTESAQARIAKARTKGTDRTVPFAGLVPSFVC